PSASSPSMRPAITATPLIWRAEATRSSARVRACRASSSRSCFSRAFCSSRSFCRRARASRGPILSMSAPRRSADSLPATPARAARARGRPGARLDAPDARGDRALGRDLEQTDLAGPAEVRATAQLGREVADLDHAYPIAVLLAEERHRAGLQRLVEIHLARDDRGVGLHLLIHQIFDAADLAVVHLAAVREVEPQVMGSDQRSGLGHVRAEYLAQGGVEKMRAGVVLSQALAARRIDCDRHLVVLAQGTLRHLDAVHDHLGAAIERVEDLAAPGAPDDPPGVAHLTAGLRVSRRLIEHDLAGLALARLAHARNVALADHRPDPRRRRQVLIAEELLGAERLWDRREERRAVGAVAGREGRAGPCALALAL